MIFPVFFHMILVMPNFWTISVLHMVYDVTNFVEIEGPDTAAVIFPDQANGVTVNPKLVRDELMTDFDSLFDNVAACTLTCSWHQDLSCTPWVVLQSGK
jgi:hypothetical protein